MTNSEEDIFFLQNDIEELKVQKLESERRLKAELTEIQAELAKVGDRESMSVPIEAEDVDPSAHVDAANDSAELIAAMEEELESLTARLAGSARETWRTRHPVP